MEFYSQYKQDKFVYETFFKEKTDGVFVEIERMMVYNLVTVIFSKI